MTFLPFGISSYNIDKAYIIMHSLESARQLLRGVYWLPIKPNIETGIIQSSSLTCQVA